MQNRLKSRRKELKLSQEELGKLVGLPYQTISKYERGENQPSIETLTKIGEKLRVNLHWLITGEGDKEINKTSQTPKHILIELKERFDLSDEDLQGLLELLESGASRDMVLRFIQVKKGNKEALDDLIKNLQGIQAIYE